MKLPKSLRNKKKAQKIADTHMAFMKYWEMSYRDFINLPIPVYVRMFEFMRKAIKEQERERKKQKRMNK